MSTLQILLSKIRALFGQHHADHAFSEEMQAHLALLEENFLRQGMSQQQAASAARKQFGNTTLLQQQHRELRTTMFFAKVWRDVHFGSRQLWKAPIFTIVAILTIALGIGANTAVFSVMHAVLLKMLPVRDASQVVYLKTNARPAGTSNTGEDATSFSYAIFDALRQQKTGFSQVIAYVPMSFSGRVAVRITGAPEEAVGDMVSGNYFSGLGVDMQSGSGLLPQHEAQHAQVVVISSAFWTRRFARDPKIIGRTLFIKSIPFVIVGVAAPGFEGTEGSASLDFWIPLQNSPDFNAWGASPTKGGSVYLQQPTWWCLRMLARIAPVVSRDQALAQAQTVYQRTAYIGIAQKSPGEKTPQMEFGAAHQFNTQDDDFAKSLKTLMAMVLLVLAIAVSNVVMLLLARNANRKREFTIRLALGASRHEVARQLLVESILLVVLGGAAAWIFAVFATHALGVWAQIDASVQPDATVLWFTSALLLLAAIVFGLAPLRSALSSQPEMVLKSASAVSQSDVQKVRVGNTVIILQIAMCLVLLVGAGLLIGTLRNLLHVPLGMQTEGLLVFGVHPRPAASPQASIAFYQSLQQQLGALPGVEAVSFAENRPGSGWSNNDSGFLVDGQKPAEDTQFRANNIGSNYFHTMGIPVLDGRDFSDADSASAPMVIIVNQTLARKFIHSATAIGHTLQVGPQQARIIGVVQDHKYTGITEQAMPMLWTTYPQGGIEGEMNVEMRTQGDPMAMLPAVRKLVQQLDPDMPLLQPMKQIAQFNRSISQQVLFARLAGFFGALAVILIATGLYGTLAYRVSRRNAEIGVRMALGARRGQVVWMVLRSSLLLVGIGVLIGVPLAMLVARALASSLYGMAPLDPYAFVSAIIGVTVVAVAASALPARRAAGIDPVGALRTN